MKQMIMKSNGSAKNRKNGKDSIYDERVMGIDPVPIKLHMPDKNYTAELNKSVKKVESLGKLLDEIGAELGNPVLIRIFKSSLFT